jgi:regulatory protein
VRQRNRKLPQPLDPDSLERLALFYVGRYATTRAKLRTYLGRKLRERGWAGARDNAVETLVEKLAALGYVDDAAFAASRAASFQRRGFGERRLAQALSAAGIAESEAEPARAAAREGALESALKFAKRKRIGPFATVRPERKERDKAYAAMIRAGHPPDVIRKIMDLVPEEFPDDDS